MRHNGFIERVDRGLPQHDRRHIGQSFQFLIQGPGLFRIHQQAHVLHSWPLLQQTVQGLEANIGRHGNVGFDQLDDWQPDLRPTPFKNGYPDLIAKSNIELARQARRQNQPVRRNIDHRASLIVEDRLQPRSIGNAGQRTPMGDRADAEICSDAAHRFDRHHPRHPLEL